MIMILYSASNVVRFNLRKISPLSFSGMISCLFSASIFSVHSSMLRYGLSKNALRHSAMKESLTGVSFMLLIGNAK
jgi:hypothetical protein